MIPVLLLAGLLASGAAPAGAAPYAAYVLDARSGEVLHSENAETRLHPASLTKMMTLYIVFEAIEHGELSLDSDIVISAKAANESPSKLGLRPGQSIKLRYLIRGAAVKSANDAATALGEAVSGSEAAFAERMNRTAKALGMTSSTFKNAHGLTADGHLSTARDMTILGRHLFYDFPEYYNLFSRLNADAGVRQVPNTNRKFLSAYRGADGIKTGFTRAAGFNLVASAERDGKRILATVFGGLSTDQRNAQVAKLLDLGFARAPQRVAINKPAKPAYQGRVGAPVVRLSADDTPFVPGVMPAGKILRVSTDVSRSPVPRLRPGSGGTQLAANSEDRESVLIAMQADIRAAVTQAATSVANAVAAPAEAATMPAQAAPAAPQPRQEQPQVQLARAPAAEDDREVVTRMSTSGNAHWGITVGTYNSRYQAERVLLTTALQENNTLDSALRKVVQGGRGWNANFVGLSEERANLACRRLQARAMPCTTFGPG